MESCGDASSEFPFGHRTISASSLPRVDSQTLDLGSPLPQREEFPFHFKTVIEPFSIKVVEPVVQTTFHQRAEYLRQAHYNPFLLRAEDVLIDLLTDSGTGALSSQQWAAMMKGDESYAGARSWFHFEQSVKDITGLSHVLPTHQGRSAERILFHAMVKPGHIVPNNTHFDTTRANIEARGATALDIPIPEARVPSVHHPFKGDMDLEQLRKLLSDSKERVPFVMLTVTNNSGGGQPVSMTNIKQVKQVCVEHGVPLILDACRFAENSWFIKQREKGYADRSPTSIAQEMFAHVDGCTMSAKKDGLSNIGGFIALSASLSDVAESCRNQLILTEGFVTYGGLAGYDLECVAIGLKEALNSDYLNYRIASIEYLGRKCRKLGIPIVEPTGGHAIYIDAASWLPHIPSSEYPAWALSCALYLIGGIRSVEIGSVMFGLQPDGTVESQAPMELVRLAFPRRMYTQSHVDYVAEVMAAVQTVAHKIRGMKIVKQPSALRHFSAHLMPVSGGLVEGMGI
ncbi:unnamed protein product [Vitrella brassicaformis CCMP3155]|uniref:Aromatic amino acid beta-eliminating lyase/threonine aldolase domain-containing protein n=1 Tax=Vitrella brassicaformis (strain CCMP3155) TaxID=1169540 RepID=A0A0G4ETD0_VITBC|nr:unnamed protein product [Vitrella brassicaformis CCMP3155]|eukprot:CEM00907.1 unnamed protein product [Vitrella brassicaformis CCMP3155]